MMGSLRKSNKYQFDSLWFDLIGFEHTRGKHANHYTIDTVDVDALCNIKWQNLLGEHMFDIQ